MRADHYYRLSPTIYPGKHSLQSAPVYEAPAGGGGVYRCSTPYSLTFFHAFQRSTNLYAHLRLGPQAAQSYNGLSERKLPNPDGTVSDADFMLNEQTIVLFHLYVAAGFNGPSPP